MEILTGAAAFLVGTALAYLNYRISKAMLRRKNSPLGTVSLVRQAVNVAFIFGLYFLGTRTALDEWALLIGGALGMTIPSFFFTPLLVKKAPSDGSGKGDEGGQ